MDIHQLKTFVAVAREGTITRASEVLHLSQPAVSAHIKAIEDAFDVVLFDRTSRGMTLTKDGERLLAKAEQALGAHQAFVDEASRMKGSLTGKLRLGAGSNTRHETLGKLMTTLAERGPDLEVVLKHGSSAEILAGLRNGSLDAGFYNESATPDADLVTLEVSRFGIHLASAPGLLPASTTPDWAALAELPWIYPPTSACCGRTAERIFEAHRIRPKRIVSVDREHVTRSLVAGGLGVGLLHADTAVEAEARNEVSLLFETDAVVRVVFAHLASRRGDPVLATATEILRARDGR